MKKWLLSFWITMTISSLTAAGKTSELDYVKNNGQWEKQVLFKADLKGGYVFLESNSLTFLFMDIKDHHGHPDHEKYEDINGEKKINPDYHQEENVLKGHVYKLNWLGANPDAILKGEDKQQYYTNYYIGNNPSKWQSNVGNYRAVYYSNLYPKIDAKLYSESMSMKTDYIIHKGANPSSIRMHYQGTDQMRIDETGKLFIKTSVNTINELRPYAYQLINGKVKEVKCEYQLDNAIVSFRLPNGYDTDHDLIIDPTLIFSTYSGSTGDNWGSSATHDAAGNMFLGGIALESGFPTTIGAFQTTFASGSGFNPTDIVITKFNQNGTSRLYSTYLGGSSNELLSSLFCTTSNELIAVLTTSSDNFPTTQNAYDRTFNGGVATSAIDGSIDYPNGSDIIIAKFNPDGSGLIGSTYFGGSGNDGLNLSSTTLFNYGDDTRSDIAVDNSGNIYIASTTASTDIPGTAGTAQPAIGGGTYDGVVAKFNASLSSLNWATYYGGTGVDAAYSISLDNASNIFICGGTNSNNLPGRANGLNTSYLGGNTDGYIAKFNNSGTSVLAATYLGTSSYDQTYLMDLDKNDNVYVFGQTLGSYPVSNGVFSNTGAKQFIHKLNNNLNSTGFSTVFGRPNYTLVNISPTAFLVDICGNIYAAGWGGGVNFNFQVDAGTVFQMPVTGDAYQSTTDGRDFYFINLNQNATSLIYGSYFGENGGVGDHVDGGTSRFDKNGIVYQAVCASCGATNGFPVTPDAVGQDNNSFNCNMAGFKFSFNLLGLQIITANATPASGCSPLTVDFSYTSTQPGTIFFWDFGDGQTSNLEFPSHTYANPDNYTAKFVIRDPNNCNPIDSAFVNVSVLGSQSTTLNRTICEGQSVTIGNQTFNQTGTFTVNLFTSNQCDSIVTLNLTVNPVGRSSISRTICEGESVTINNQTFSQPGNYTITTQSTLGCDSIISLNLTVNPDSDTSFSRTICPGESVTVANQTFSAAGTFTINLTSGLNCDSTILLTVIQLPNSTTNLTQSICSGQSITIGNQTFSETGNYSVTLPAANGCDSIINLNLTVSDILTTDLILVVCTGTVITVGNQSYNQTGIYTDTLTSAQGCDSVINLNLTVTDTITETISATICEGERYPAGNQVFDQTGTYTIALTASAGCDSILVLSLTVLETVFETVNVTICSGDSVTIGNQIFKDEGNYAVLLESAAGCDSTVNLNLTVIQPKTTAVQESICEGTSITIGNETFAEEGNYTINLIAADGCDSIVSLSLTVNSLPIIDAVTDKVAVLPGEQVQLDVIAGNAYLYNWTPADAVSNAGIANPTAVVNTPTWFVVTATDRQTDCEAVDSVFVDIENLPCTKENIFIPNAFSPNGDGVNDIFIPRSSIEFISIQLLIYDRWGIKVFESTTVAEGWNGEYKNQPAQPDAYGYYFIGECAEGEKITLKGNVTLLR
jgi:gliding motility-associated-like protein